MSCPAHPPPCLANIIILDPHWHWQPVTDHHIPLTKPDVAFIAYFTLLATVSSIIQQFYDYTFWKDIMEAQFLYAQEHAHDAEVQYQNAIFGLKLALSYVREYYPRLPLSHGTALDIC